MSIFSLRSLEKLARVALLLAAVMMVIAAFRVDILGSDAPHHYYWLHAFPELVWQGDLRPTWLPEAYNGLGAPTFYFYPPLTYWIATPLYPLISGLSDVRYFTIIGLIAIVLAFFSFRFYIRRKGVTSSVAFWSSLLYAVAPFRVYEFFTRSGLSAQVAIIFIPLIFAAIDGLIEGKQKSRYYVLLSISAALLILTNVPVLVMTCTIIAVYLVILIVQRAPNILHVIAGLFTGVLIACFYLLPIPTLVQYVQSGHLEMSKGIVADGIVAIQNILRWWDITEGAHSSLNLLTAIVALCLAIVAYRRRNELPRRTLLLLISCFALIVFFQISFLSGPLWSIEKVRTLIQFPHRWSIILVFAFSIAYGLLQDTSVRKWLLIGVAVWGMASFGFSTLVAFNLRVNVRPEIKTPFDPPEYAPADAPRDMKQVIQIAKEHGSDPQIQASRTLEQGESLKETKRGYDKLTYEAHLGQPTVVTFQQWYWPYWELQVSHGSEIKTHADSLGRLIAVLPAGVAEYDLQLTESAPERWGKWLSILGLAVCVGYTYVLRKNERQGKER